MQLFLFISIWLHGVKIEDYFVTAMFSMAVTVFFVPLKMYFFPNVTEDCKLLGYYKWLGCTGLSQCLKAFQILFVLHVNVSASYKRTLQTKFCQIFYLVVNISAVRLLYFLQWMQILLVLLIAIFNFFFQYLGIHMIVEKSMWVIAVPGFVHFLM